MLRLEANADPVRFSVFLTERPPKLKIDRLPGNDAAQCAADGRPGAGEHRVLLDRLPQELDQKDRKRTISVQFQKQIIYDGISDTLSDILSCYL